MEPIKIEQHYLDVIRVHEKINQTERERERERERELIVMW
jgi:hypothetical protein